MCVWETDLVEFKLDTGDTSSKKQAVRRIPFTKQLEKMQKNGVLKPSKGPWASSVVIVKKKDGLLRFLLTTELSI